MTLRIVIGYDGTAAGGPPPLNRTSYTGRKFRPAAEGSGRFGV
jgi:hypothetical protein